jgi:DnaJ family protein C protein 28
MPDTRKKPGDTWENHVEQQIREAMERGDFDNLKGTGKPLDLRPYPGDPAQEMADKIVRDAGLAPAWIELEREIDDAQKAAADTLLRTWRWCEAARGDAIENPQWLDAEWRKARDIYERRLHEINNKILSFNLHLPPPLLHRQRARLRIDAEFKRLGIKER